MRFRVLGILVLLMAAPGLTHAHHYKQGGRPAPGALRALDHPTRADFLDPAATPNVRGAARAARLALLPCRTGFQLAAVRREAPLLNAGRFAQRCTTWAGVVSFN